MSKSPPRPPCHSPALSRETASVCVSARGWGGIFMPLKRLTLLLNNCSNLLSQVVTLCSPWPAEQPSSEVQNMKAGEGRSREEESAALHGRGSRRQRGTKAAVRGHPHPGWEGLSRGAFQSQLQPHTSFQRAQTAPFHLFILSCFALQHSPVCTSVA